MTLKAIWHFIATTLLAAGPLSADAFVFSDQDTFSVPPNGKGTRWTIAISGEDVTATLTPPADSGESGAFTFTKATFPHALTPAGTVYGTVFIEEALFSDNPEGIISDTIKFIPPARGSQSVTLLFKSDSDTGDGGIPGPPSGPCPPEDECIHEAALATKFWTITWSAGSVINGTNQDNTDTIAFYSDPVTSPEPHTLVFLCTVFLGVGFAARRRMGMELVRADSSSSPVLR